MNYNDRYRGINGSRRVILMNETDIEERGLKQGEVVDITSYFDDGERHAEQFYRRSVSDSATLRGDVFSRSKCFSAAQKRRQKQ